LFDKFNQHELVFPDPDGLIAAQTEVQEISIDLERYGVHKFYFKHAILGVFTNLRNTQKPTEVLLPLLSLHLCLKSFKQMRRFVENG